MNRIIRLWNQNRKQIIIIGLAVVFFFVIIQLLNQIAKQQKKGVTLNNTNVIEVEEKLPTESIISAQSVSKEVTKQNTNLIDEFINNCNNGNIAEAYNLLTDKCKEILFPTEEIFKTNYYDIIFTQKRIYNIENWISASSSNTYLIEYFSDVMSTGKVQEEIDFQDYITIEKNESGKININSFISYKQINKSNENENIKITVIGKQIYKEYEQYEIEVENKSNKAILLDTKEKEGTISMYTDENVKYTANLNDVASEEFIINGAQVVNYKIKFSKIYDTSTDIVNITFSDIVKDYDLYSENQANYNEIMQLTVEI